MGGYLQESYSVSHGRKVEVKGSTESSRNLKKVIIAKNGRRKQIAR